MNPKLVAKIESEEPKLRLAVLIDADNVSASVVGGLLTEVASFGEATVKRIYGDFTSPQSSIWRQCLNKYAIKPIQQFAYTKGKNATDSTLIIDAMDLLYTRRFDGFCLVSSDSDFTGLATRIREEGLWVFGFGESKTPEAFRNACHKFIFTEILRPVSSQESTVIPAMEASQVKSTTAPHVPTPVNTNQQIKEFPQEFLFKALENVCDDTGWEDLANFGSYLTKLQPDFDPRSYGFNKLNKLIRSKPDLFELEERPVPNSDKTVLYIRAKRSS